MIGGHKITGRTIVAGVAGQPVAHSLSPILHNAWLQAAGIDGVYVAFPLDRNGFEPSAPPPSSALPISALEL